MSAPAAAVDSGPDPEGMLTHFDRAKQEVREAATIAAVKVFVNKAAAVRAYAKLAKDRQLLDRATELRLHAERRMGQLLEEMEQLGEKAKKGGDPKSRPSTLATLKSLGISKDEAARAKRLAEPATRDFDHAVAEAKKAGELSDKIVVKRATKLAAKRKREVGAWPFRGTWTAEEITEATTWFRAIPKGAALKQRLAEAGCAAKQVLGAIRYCADASDAYVTEAVTRAIGSRDQKGNAAMLYGDGPPGDGLAIFIAIQAEALKDFPADERTRILGKANAKAAALCDALRAREEARWRKLYGKKRRHSGK